MANNASNWLEELLLKWAFTNASVTRPTTWYLGYATASAEGSVTEPVGNGYARMAVTWTPTESPSGTWTIANSALIDFPAASGGNHGTVTHLVAFDALTSGNYMANIPLAVSQVINDGNILRVAAGAATLTLE